METKLMPRPARTYQDPTPALKAYIREHQQAPGGYPSQRDVEYWNAGEDGPGVPRRVIRDIYKQLSGNNG